MASVVDAAASAPLSVSASSSQSTTTAASMKKENEKTGGQLKVLSWEEVAQHTTPESAWVVWKGKVYDVTDFLPDHPGGDEIVLQFCGKDVTEVMKSDEHVHSQGAYDLMEDYLIGALSQSDKSLEGEKASKEMFLDFSKPLIPQVWAGNYSKETYLEQVHIPRHVKGQALLLGGFLENFTMTPWYVIPILYIPAVIYTFLLASRAFGPFYSLLLYIGGLCLWTLIEYTLHRFVFHIDTLLPDNRIAITLHFLLHGIHHFLPMDKMRLVMPPAKFITLATCVISMMRQVLPDPVVAGLISGAFSGYIAYDLTHYYIHHGRPHTAVMRAIKKNHLDHHYKDPNLDFGVTSAFWDHVFGTRSKMTAGVPPSSVGSPPIGVGGGGGEVKKHAA
uniref:Fatty acid 2-hydroxylase n=1 Tax=Chromera velia CCMP2878 TaxID=1169474 RepID=A0A0G4I673_9ALVE|eukprot:Cvel_1883.t1-p1 / transcript=Cvel_1883.t1 / gene=Cvel_1883 / organism=Chromera_velia_CCMP2878 / gene_product=Ceramide very long chain fatty acid hydroxylase, putative / transcript_product=Ceramide very long chain fatty acid hydroxylase, putative / location=Cvel_scaffold70:86880-88046(+) / protein_length=389 / sequence_SO=supercontig / SO=protein_coding / is_pseudo=false